MSPGARLAIAFLGVALLVFIDLGTKSWAAAELRPRGPRTVGLVRLHYQENRGGVFRRPPRPRVMMLSDAAIALVLTGLLIAQRRGRLLLAGLALLLGGVLGNLLDRLEHGHVIDFIEIGRWPVFNIADVALAVGLAIALAGLPARRRAEV